MIVTILILCCDFEPGREPISLPTEWDSETRWSVWNEIWASSYLFN